MLQRPKQSYSKLAKIVILLFSSLCIVITVGLSYFITTNQLRAEVEQANMSLLREVNGKLLVVLKSIDAEAIQFLRSRNMWTFMEDEAAEQADIIAINTRIGDLLLSNNMIFSIDLYSYAKKKWSHTNPFQQQEPDVDYDWINAFAQYKGFYQLIGTRKLSIDDSNTVFHNVMTLIRSYPLTHADGYRKGAVAFNIDELSIYSLIKHAIDPAIGYMFIADSEGVIISHADKRLIGTNVNDRFSAAELQASDEGHFSQNIGGTDSTVFHMKSPYTGWKIISVVADAGLSKPLVKVRNMLLIIAGALLVLAAIMSVTVNSWMFRPVNRMLTNVAKQLKSYRAYEREPEQMAAIEAGNIETSLSFILEDSSRMHRQMRESTPVIKWRLVMDALIGVRTKADELLPSLEAIGYPMHACQFIVLAVELDRRSEIRNANDLQLYCYALCNVAEEMINSECLGVAIEAREGLVVIMISFAEADSEANILRTLAVAELIKSYVEEQFKRTISIGVGGIAEGLEQLQRSYHEALSALSYKMILGGNAVISSEEIREPASGEFLRLLAMTDGIVEMLRLTDRDKMKRQTERWFEEMASVGAAADMIRQLVVQFMMKVVKAVGEIDPLLLDAVPTHQRFDLLSQYENIQQLSDYVIGQLGLYSTLLEEKRSNREKNDVIDRIALFIDENYMHSDLSLNYLASEFKLSMSHVSRMFKEHTEKNFIDYLMEIRMRKAKELLECTDMLVRDVAAAVGYTNVNSFARIFKKSTGLTPGEYRERELERDHI
ncbi:helix-turn-helix domain-containing protein [Paenibacillus sp. GCM10027626]|uniref:helix-turn-helix domain-containing protein n=1 Tax=Paenibacillus sp. GCM10027626 TaxID=3273411 RepID=UPI00362A2599